MKFSLDENLTKKEKIYDRFLLLLAIQIAVGFIFIFFNADLGKIVTNNIVDYPFLFIFVPLLIVAPYVFIFTYLFESIGFYILSMIIYVKLIIFIVMLWKRLIVMARRKNLPFIGNINNYESFKKIFLKILQKSLIISAIVAVILSIVMFMDVKLNFSYINWKSGSNGSAISAIIEGKSYIDILIYFVRAFIGVLATYMICYLVCKKTTKTLDTEKLETKYEKTIKSTLARTIFFAAASFFDVMYMDFVTTYNYSHIFFIIYMVFAILIKTLCYDKMMDKSPISLKNRIIIMVKLALWFVFLTICITFVKHSTLYWVYYAVYTSTVIQKVLYIGYIVVMCLTYFLSTLDIKKKNIDKNENINAKEQTDNLVVQTE